MDTQQNSNTDWDGIASAILLVAVIGFLGFAPELIR